MTSGFILTNLFVCTIIFFGFCIFPKEKPDGFLHQARLIHYSESNVYLTTLISRLVEL
jgi:hypothetical protein